MDGDDALADGSDVVVLGREVAAARATEERHVAPGPSPVTHVVYPTGASDMWRWVDCSQDAAMSAFVSNYAAADEPSRATIRACLTMEDLYTVLLFARRRAFAAIRTGDSGAVVEAFDAVSAVDIDRVDWRDVVVATMLAAYAASSSGVPAAVAAAGAVACAVPPVAEIMSDAVSRDTTDLAASCGYRVVSTSAGPVLFEYGYQSHEPNRDLVPIALGIAAMIENDRTYRVDALSVGSDLPPIWVGGTADARVGAAIKKLSGCISIYASPVAGLGHQPGEHFLLVYLAEAATPDDAARIARGTSHGGRPGAVVLGLASGRICVVVVAACVLAFEPSFEDAETMARFHRAITALLG